MPGPAGAVSFDLHGMPLDLGPLDAAGEVIAPGRGSALARATALPTVGAPADSIATWDDHVGLFAPG
jgi:hypothetical protein